jgi:hypothetical protein
MSQKKFFVIGFLFGLAIFAVLLILVFATGSTLGQRCAVNFAPDSAAWTECIHRLSQ